MSYAGPNVRLAACILAAGASGNASVLQAQGFVDDWIRSFADSEIVFTRSSSNAPFPPLAFASASHYGDTEVRLADGRVVTYNQNAISQAAVVPFLVTPRDALFIGEWLS